MMSNDTGSQRTKILVIDDNVHILRSLKLLIESDFDVELTTVPSVVECKTALNSSYFDIVITDYDIGDGTCFDVVKILKEKNISIPVILITALGSKELAVESINKQFFAYLEKPIQPDQIKTVLSAALDKKLKEDSEQRLVRLGLNSGELIHELVTPLSIALFRISSLRKHMKTENPSERTLKLIDSIENTINRINILISSSKKTLREGNNFHEFMLKDLEDIVQESCSRKSAQVKVTLTIQMSPDAKGYGDQHQLSQVLINLVNNAIDAVASFEDRWVRLSTVFEDQHLSFVVTDSGSGIPENLRERIFHPLFTTKREEGTGLGLFISDKIIRSHNGSLYINSSAKNTEFIVKIPKAKN